MEKDRPHPPTYLLVALVASGGLHLLLPGLRFVEFPYSLVGLVPLGVGVYLNLVADRLFKGAGTTVKPFEESSALIQAFPFSLTRNPMYLGFALILLGVGILLGSLWALGPAMLFPAVVNRRFIRAEESMLGEKFGREWEEYRGRVRRWL